MVITITVRVQLETLPETDQKGEGGVRYPHEEEKGMNKTVEWLTCQVKRGKRSKHRTITRSRHHERTSKRSINAKLNFFFLLFLFGWGGKKEARGGGEEG
jgi:hypothetical protein